MASSPVHHGDAFLGAVDFLIDVLEGGGRYSDRNSDRGGRTKWGISERSYPGLDIRALTRDQATRVYYDDFWIPCYGDNLDAPLALAFFCCYVNLPPREAVKCLQRALETVKVDGRLGSQTLGTARRYRPQQTIRAQFAAECNLYYYRLCEALKDQKVNLKGWTRRVTKVSDEAGIWAGREE